MAERPTTCGQGLAANAPLPAKLGELIAALAQSLEAHTTALDLTDEHSRREHGVYLHLAEAYRAVAARLQATGEEMAGYRDLPMGRHNVQTLSSPAVVGAFRQFVQREQELLALLQERLEGDRQLLAEADGMGAEG